MPTAGSLDLDISANPYFTKQKYNFDTEKLQTYVIDLN